MGRDGSAVALPAAAQDLLIPKESEGLRKLGPKNLRHKSAARGGWAGMALLIGEQDLLIPNES